MSHTYILLSVTFHYFFFFWTCIDKFGHYCYFITKDSCGIFINFRNNCKKGLTMPWYGHPYFDHGSPKYTNAIIALKDFIAHCAKHSTTKRSQMNQHVFLKASWYKLQTHVWFIVVFHSSIIGLNGVSCVYIVEQ